jgi:redox-sensitive bicupin YhaK (pirin superfamily)
MTAGRGIIHSEMPEQEEGRMAGFQLWVNLAAADKMAPPAYRDIAPAQVPVYTDSSGVSVRVVAGQSHGTAGAVSRPKTEPVVLDVTIPPGRTFDAEIPAGHNAFAYVFGGTDVDVGEGAAATRVEPDRMAILANHAEANGVRFAVPAGATEAARVLVVAGRPLGEPIAQYGPFVMNTTAELQRAFQDFQRGVLAT